MSLHASRGAPAVGPRGRARTTPGVNAECTSVGSAAAPATREPAAPPADRVLRPLTLDDVLADVVRRTGASVGAVYLFEPAGDALRLAVVCGLPVDFVAPWHRVAMSDPVPAADAVRGDRLVWVGSHEEMARVYPRAAAVLPYRFALAAVPVTGTRRIWGALVLLWPSSHPDRASRRERGHITASGRMIGRVLDETGPEPLPETPRVVTLAQAARPAGPQDAVADFAERLPGAASLDLEGKMTYVSANAARLLGRRADALVGTRPWQSLPWLDAPVYEDHYRTAIVGRESVTYSVLRPPDRWLTFHLHPDPSGISVLIAPGRMPDGPVHDPRPAAAPAAPRTGRLYQLVHLAAALTETVAVRDVVDLVTDQVLPAFAAQGLIIYTVEAGRLSIIGHHGYAAEIIEGLDHLTIDTELTPTGRAVSGGSPCFFADRAQLRRAYPRAPALSDKQAWAFLPLVVSGRPVGCCILSYEQPHTFSADERAVLTSLAGLLAAALDRARLYDAQHAVAHDLQQALLPRALPRMAGLEVAARYLPAGHGVEVGGDFYDLIELTEDSAAAVIGDVQGHSIAAAALMGQVRTAVHAHAAAGASPDEILARTSRIILDLEPELLASCLYAHLDFARDRATLATAGHPAPLLRRPGERAAPVPLDPGPLLGIDTCFSYPTTTIDLPRGSLLAFFTDGLIEVPGTDPDLVADVLADTLTDHDPKHLDRILDFLLDSTRPGVHLTDDIALLLVHRLPE